MREEETNWEDELPSPEELMPLTQTLISPDLAIAFDIPNTNQNQVHHQNQQQQQQPSPSATQGGGATQTSTPPPQGNSSSAAAEYGSGDEPARTLKRPRLVWTPQLHKRFVDAVAHLGIKNAVPKTIMQLMSVDGLTRENVASHLQKYRLYLKRMQGIHSNSNNGGSGGSNGGLSDPATDRLFASSPVPAHFLRPNSDHFMPSYVPVTAMQMPVPVPMVGHGHPQLQQHHHQFRGHFGNSPPNGGGNGQFEQHPFLARQSQVQSQRLGATVVGNNSNGVIPPSSSYVEDMESAAPANGRKVLTLFPTADD